MQFVEPVYWFIQVKQDKVARVGWFDQNADYFCKMKFPMPLPHLWLTTSKLIYKSHDQTQQIIEGFVLMMFVTKRMMINDITISAQVSSVPNQME